MTSTETGDRLLTVDFVVLVLPVFNGGDIEGCSVWKDESIWFLSQGEEEGKGLSSLAMSHQKMIRPLQQSTDPANVSGSHNRIMLTLFEHKNYLFGS